MSPYINAMTASLAALPGVRTGFGVIADPAPSH